ncbi:MAG TPA: DNA repair protein RecN [Bacteroidia bacterium]|nr:DNA repair protein RecN [Bacteroidia bacterium]
MLQRILIQNYALIDSLELDLNKGLNIITGETGAGKSILLGALSLILGQRSDSSSLLDKNRKCIIEGEFVVQKNNHSIPEFFKSNELDFDKTILVRREISPEGKSRAFINDTPVNLQQLKELGVLLVDIHSQHETLLLNQSNFQLSILDAFSDHKDILQNYYFEYSQYRKLERDLKLLKEEETRSKADQDYFEFQFRELEDAQLKNFDIEKLEDEFKTLTHAGDILVGLEQILGSLNSGEQNVITQISNLYTQLLHLSKYNSGLAESANRMKSVLIELKDIEKELENSGNEIQADPGRLEIVNEQLNIVHKLQQKHRVNTIEDLIRIKVELEGKLQGIQSLDDKILQCENSLTSSRQKLTKLSTAISSKRSKSIPLIENTIKKLLSEVAMPNAVLKIENTILPEGEWGPQGIDQIRFLFSANKGIAYSEISKVASGGELSRLMLCIKSAVARLIELPSIVFDEIDTGVSGETAFKIGKVMQDMASKHQLIAITHLPQIASRGEAHFFVYKDVTGKKTFTHVKRLNSDERVVEIARMLSGDKPTAVAMANAKELLKV